jgi:uncharacterized protein YbjT (DUF2867 family)
MPDIICVTGATGFIASWIIAAALKLNYRSDRIIASSP